MQQAPKQKIIVYCLLVFSLLVAACAANQSATLLAKATASTTAAASEPPTRTPNPTETASPTRKPSTTPTLTASFTPTQTIEPTATSTATPIPIVAQCISPVQAQLSDLKMDGVLVVDEDAFQDLHSNQYMLNLVTQGRINLRNSSNRWLRGFEVSPDYSNLAYLDGNRNNQNDTFYVVRDGNGKIITNHYAEKDWYGFAGWQDSQHLLINLEKRQYGFVDMPLALVRWAPYSGDKEVLSPEYPDIEYIIDPVNTWGGYVFAPTVYDPSMQYVVYPWVDKNGKAVISLWDLKSKGAVLNITKWYGDVGNQPKWSPNGSAFLINLPIDRDKLEDLYQVDTNGQLKQLTYLSQKFSEVEFGGYSWSPDGSQIAFWVRTKPDIWNEPGDAQRPRTPLRLATVDVITGHVRSLCLPGEGWGKSVQGEYSIEPSSPIWSPDGKHLAVGAGTTGQGGYMVIIDLEQNKSWRFGANSAALGWLTAIP